MEYVTAFGYKMKAARVCVPSGWFRTPEQRADARKQFISEIGNAEGEHVPIPDRLIPILKKQYQLTGLCSGWEWREKYRPDAKRPDYGAVEQLLSAIQAIGLKRVEITSETRDPIMALRLKEPIEYKLDIVRRSKKEKVIDEIAGWLLLPAVGVAAYFIYLILFSSR